MNSKIKGVVVVFAYSEVIAININNYLKDKGFDVVMSPLENDLPAFTVSVPKNQLDDAFKCMNDYYKNIDDDSLSISYIDNCRVVVDSTIEKTL